MKCYFCGYNIKEKFLIDGDVIKIAGHFHKIKCPGCKEWCDVFNVNVEQNKNKEN